MTARRRRKSSDWPMDARSVRMQCRADQSERSHCDLLSFWRRCTNVRCRRNHACTGEPTGCFKLRWAALPDDYKECWLGAIEARMNGARTVQALVRAARARFEKFKPHGGSDIAGLGAGTPARPVDRLPGRW